MQAKRRKTKYVGVSRKSDQRRLERGKIFIQEMKTNW